MGMGAKLGEGADALAKAAGRSAKRTAKKYPKSTAAAAGYTAGVVHTSWAHSNPEFYDSTPNKGRAEDKHPYG